MNNYDFLDLPQTDASDADVIVIPLPYEATVSYGRGTAGGPAAILRASAEVETWDDQTCFDLETLRYHTADPLIPLLDEPTAEYLRRVETAAAAFHSHRGLVVGIGGEHGLTPPLVRAAAGQDDLSGITVVQLDAHADLCESYGGSIDSHASAMRRLVERGADLIAVGIRSMSREEAEFTRGCEQIRTFYAGELAAECPTGAADRRAELLTMLSQLQGDVYLTIDIDALEVALCPGTGTPQPGGLGWWPTLNYLHALLVENQAARLIGVDLVETAPQPGTQVNEFTAALLLAKVVAYHYHRRNV